jgi:uncharacterized protein DUF4035
MLHGGSMRHLLEWRAYYDLEPFGEERADYRSAQIVTAILNVNRKKGAPIVKLRDCLLQFGADSAAATSPEEARKKIIRTMELLVAIHNAPTDEKKESKPRAKRLRT